VELQLAIARASGDVKAEEHVSILARVFPNSDLAGGTVDAVGSGGVDGDLEGWVDGCTGTLSRGYGSGGGGCRGDEEEEEGDDCGEELHFWRLGLVW